MLAAGPAVGAGLFDSLFGPAKPEPAASTIRNGLVWEQGQFNVVRLELAESNAKNAQPATVSTERLQSLLASVQVKNHGDMIPLFEAAEVTRLAPALSVALARADARQDIIIFSSERRGVALLSPKLGIAARAFSSADTVQLIVGVARLDFFDQYRAAQVMPEFSYGSRWKAMPVELRADGASYPGGEARRDWLAWPIAQATAPKPAEPAAAPRAAPAERAAPSAERDDRYFDQQEQRLRRIQRLREQGLITEEEYQEKKKEILKDL